MKFLAKVFVVILVALAFSASLGATVDCEGGHEAECSTECACFCCSTPAFVPLKQTSSLKTSKAEHAWTSDMSYMGKPSVADIFRPPISA